MSFVAELGPNLKNEVIVVLVDGDGVRFGVQVLVVKINGSFLEVDAVLGVSREGIITNLKGGKKPCRGKLTKDHVAVVIMVVGLNDDEMAVS